MLTEIDYDTDAQWLAAIGTEHWGSDWCQAGIGKGNISFYRQEYKNIADAIQRTGRKIAFGVWSHGRGRPWLWAGEFAHYWRTGTDMRNTWAAVMDQVDNVLSIPEAADAQGPGRYHFLDSLERVVAELVGPHCHGCICQ